MKKKWATSYDVAKVAGVSQSAVSRTFSPGRNVSKETREKVLAAAQKLGFAPNPTAKSLRLGRTGLVGFVITQFAHRNFPIVLKSALDILSKTGENLVLQMVESKVDADEAVDRLIEARVDMIICAADVTPNAAVACKNAGLPIVIINRHLEIDGVDHVSSNHDESMQGIAKMLCKKGISRSIYLDGPSSSWVNTQRREGFLKGCQAAGMPQPLIISGDYTVESGFDAIKSLDIRQEGIEVVVSSNDAMAIGAIDALREIHAMSVPSDLLVIGYDDTANASLRAYNLTTVRQDMNALVSMAIKLGFERITNPNLKGRSIVLDSKIIERSSKIL